MLVNITGPFCVSCSSYTQYYTIGHGKSLERTNCGYCGLRGKNTKPGDKCSRYSEMANVMLPFKCMEKLLSMRNDREQNVCKN